MANGSIDYDYDEVISYIPGTPCTAVNDLATNLNTLGNNLDNMQDAFHSSDNTQVVGQIYIGFSNIIGDSTKGLAKLVIESADILNVCYNEAMNDKKIVENGTSDGTTSDVGAAEGANGINESTSYYQSEKTPTLDEVQDYIDENLPTNNWGHSLEDDMNKSGNPEAYLNNLDNLTHRLTDVDKDLAEGGYSFTINGFSGGTHSTSNNNPNHGMGAKSDITFYKDGVQLNKSNITKEDMAYIEAALSKNGLGMQYEAQGSYTGWGDVYLNQALNKDGNYVTYDGKNWGNVDNSIYNADTDSYTYK